MNQKIAFLTTIFPMNKKYLYNFFDSLENQTYQDFDIVVVNDGYSCFEEIISKYKNLNIIELKYSKSIAKNREYGINYVIDHMYDILIFGDSDDCFKDNRVQVSIDKLIKYDIVVNDLSLFNSDSIYNKKYISTRVDNNTEIDSEFIKDKNIFGMSNTAVNVNILDKVKFDNELIAVDWYFYTTLLLKKNKALFTNETETLYRQYTNNTVGIGTITDDSVSKGVLVKLKQYGLLKKEYFEFEKFYYDTINLQRKIENIEYINFMKKRDNKNTLWWEDIRLIKDDSENSIDKKA